MTFQQFILISSLLPFSQYISDFIEKNNYKIIAVYGASCSGKTTLAHEIKKSLGDNKAVLISVDDYWCYTREEMKQKNLTGYDWQARNKPRFLKDLEFLKNKKSIEKPIQDYEFQRPSSFTEYITPKDIIILEATLDFSDIADLIIFTYAPDNIILERRLKRDSHKKSFKSEKDLENYLIQKSIPAYKEKLFPLINKSHFIFDTYLNKFFINKKFKN